MYEIGQATAKGPSRPYNQDSVLVQILDGGSTAPTWLLAAVADGLGGEPGGELASEIAVTTLRQRLTSSTRAPDQKSVVRAYREAHQRIRSVSRTAHHLQRMGTTLASVLAATGGVLIANVGDSRVYLVDERGIEQLTTDHSVVADQVRQGLITEEGAASSPFRNVITRFVGVRDSTPEVDVVGPVELPEGVRILLCTDGVHGVLSRDELATVVANGGCQAAAERLVSLAHSRGGEDDASAVVIMRREEVLGRPDPRPNGADA